MTRNRHVLADTLVNEHSATNIVVFDSQRLNINKWRPNIHQLPYGHSQKDYHIQAFNVEHITMDFGPCDREHGSLFHPSRKRENLKLVTYNVSRHNRSK